jgi:hypothetical protein
MPGAMPAGASAEFASQDRCQGDRQGPKAAWGEWLTSCISVWKVNYAVHGGKTMHEAHWKAAELHELAAQPHRTSAEHNEKGDRSRADWHSERALEYSNHAYKLAKEALTRSGEIESP